MNLWMWLLLACLLGYAWKLLGYLVPASLLHEPPHVPDRRHHDHRPAGVADDRQHGGVRARLWRSMPGWAPWLPPLQRLFLRAPFLVVVLAGAGAAALLRLPGWN